MIDSYPNLVELLIGIWVGDVLAAAVEEVLWKEVILWEIGEFADVVVTVAVEQGIFVVFAGGVEVLARG